MSGFLKNREPMNELFLNWMKEHIQELLERGIISEIREQTRETIDKQVNPCQTVYYYSATHIGVVSVWQEGAMDMETLNIEPEKAEYYQHVDKKTGKILKLQKSEYYQHFETIVGLRFEDILEEFFQQML